MRYSLTPYIGRSAALVIALAPALALSASTILLAV